MSYILEALKKAEHQREIGHVPGIGSAHESAGIAGAGRWVWMLLAVLLLNAVLLAFALWPESASKSRPVSAPGPTDTAARPQASLPPSPEPVLEWGEEVHQPLQPPQPRVSRDMPEMMSPPPVPLTPLRPLPPASESPGRDVVEATEFADPVVAEPQVAKFVPPPVAATVSVGDNNLPVWPQVSDQLFRAINSALHLDVHVYSDQPHERFVLINMRKLHEGEQLQEGPMLDAITPDGVILSFRGQRFRMQSQ
jgi:general secretion pathway protein B